MKDQDLDNIAQKWADDQVASVPKLRPTAEMYERVASYGRRRSLGALLARRSAWTAALAVVVLVLAFALVQWFPLVVPGGGQQLALRAVFDDEKGTSRGGPPKGKGPSGGTTEFGLLEFQVQGADASTLRSVNLLAGYARPMVLTEDDSYRLAIGPAETRYVYVYQRSPAGALAPLYPNNAYNPKQNPVGAAETIYLPTEPDGFYLKGGQGTFRLYVVAAEQPLLEMEALDARYTRRGIQFDRRESLALLQERLDAIVDARIGTASGWVFEFEMR